MQLHVATQYADGGVLWWPGRYIGATVIADSYGSTLVEIWHDPVGGPGFEAVAQTIYPGMSLPDTKIIEIYQADQHRIAVMIEQEPTVEPVTIPTEVHG